MKIRVQELEDPSIQVVATLYKNIYTENGIVPTPQLDSYVLNVSNLLEVEGKKDWFVEEPSGQALYDSWYINVTTNYPGVLGLTFSVHHLPSIVKYQVIFAALILFWVYFLIIFELVHRTIAAMMGAFIALALVSKIHERPSLAEVIGWIDFETCGLLFGMMVMVNKKKLKKN